MDGRRRLVSRRYRIRLTGPLASLPRTGELLLVRGLALLYDLPALDDAVEVDDDGVALLLQVELLLTVGDLAVHALAEGGVVLDEARPALELPCLALVRVAVEECEMRVRADVRGREAVSLAQP